MESIKKLEEILDRTCMDSMYGETYGNCRYYSFGNGNIGKVYATSTALVGEIVSKTAGKIDCVELPFENYFEPVRCTEEDAPFYQSLQSGKWMFEGLYEHVLPTKADFERIASALRNYLALFSGRLR